MTFTTAGQDELSPDQRKEAYIRPAGDLERSTGDSFAVKRDYTIRYGEIQMASVPVRATVKQFESCWYGPLPSRQPGTLPNLGTIRASLTALTGGQLGSGSWIANNTDLDLRECYLVFARAPSLNSGQRYSQIDVLRIGALPAGKTRNDLDLASPADALVTRLDNVTKQWLGNATMQYQGRRGVQQYEQPVDRSDAARALAAAMISLLSDLPSQDAGGLIQTQGGQKIKPFTELPREGARWLDMRNVLDGPQRAAGRPDQHARSDAAEGQRRSGPAVHRRVHRAGGAAHE